MGVCTSQAVTVVETSAVKPSQFYVVKFLDTEDPIEKQQNSSPIKNSIVAQRDLKNDDADSTKMLPVMIHHIMKERNQKPTPSGIKVDNLYDNKMDDDDEGDSKTMPKRIQFLRDVTKKCETVRATAKMKQLLENNPNKSIIVTTNTSADFFKEEFIEQIFYYLGKRILSAQVMFEQFQEGFMIGDAIVKKAGQRQTIIQNSASTITLLDTPEELQDFMKKNSQYYNNTTETQFLAKGGEAIVYRVEHNGLDEIVIKCPLIDRNMNKEELFCAYQSIFYESQLMKLIAHPDYIAQIKEEIIEISPLDNIITRYCSVVEQAQHTLADILDIWSDPVLSKDKCEFYSPEKLSFYFLQALCAMEYLHQKNIFYGDMKAPNLLVFRSQQVKIGDFGISFKMDKQLIDIDKNALRITFEKACKIVSKLESKERFPDSILYYADITEDLVNSQLSAMVKLYTKQISKDFNFFQRLSQQLQKEYKPQAIQNIYKWSKYRSLIYDILKNKEIESKDQIPEDIVKLVPEQHLTVNIKRSLDREMINNVPVILSYSNLQEQELNSNSSFTFEQSSNEIQSSSRPSSQQDKKQRRMTKKISPMAQPSEDTLQGQGRKQGPEKIQDKNWVRLLTDLFRSLDTSQEGDKIEALTKKYLPDLYLRCIYNEEIKYSYQEFCKENLTMTAEKNLDDFILISNLYTSLQSYELRVNYNNSQNYFQNICFHLEYLNKKAEVIKTMMVYAENLMDMEKFYPAYVIAANMIAKIQNDEVDLLRYKIKAKLICNQCKQSDDLMQLSKQIIDYYGESSLEFADYSLIMSDTYKQQENYTKAIRLGKKALKLYKTLLGEGQSKTGITYQKVSELAENVDDKQLYVQCTEKAAKQDPNTRNYYQLTKLYMDLKAEKRLKELLSVQSNNFLLRQLLLVINEMGHYYKSIVQYEFLNIMMTSDIQHQNIVELQKYLIFEDLKAQYLSIRKQTPNHLPYGRTLK